MIWTGREDALGLYHLVSADQGRNWAAPRRVGGEMARHASMAVGRNGVIATVWDEWINGEWTIMVSVSSENGPSGSAPLRLSDYAARVSSVLDRAGERSAPRLEKRVVLDQHDRLQFIIAT